MKYLIFLLLLAGALSAQAQKTTAQKVTIPGSALRNCYRIDTDIYRCEQPMPDDFKALEKYGIKEVINLRYWHSDDDEAAGTRLKLHRIATRAISIDEEDIIKILRIIKNRKGPVVFHCLHGSDRTGAVCAMYRIVFQHVPKETAIKEMTDGGFGFHVIFSQIIDMIREADITKIRQELEKP